MTWLKVLFSSVLLLVSATSFGQPLREINYRYLYDPTEPIRFDIEPVRLDTGWLILSRLHFQDTSLRSEDFTILWQSRASLSTGQADTVNATSKEAGRTAQSVTYEMFVPSLTMPTALVANIVQIKQRRAWIYYVLLTANYPVASYAMTDEEVVMHPYLRTGSSVRISGSQQQIVSYYNDNFPPGIPAFAEAQSQVARAMKSDSVFILDAGQTFVPDRKGLYLVQNDTAAREGIAFRAEEDYPKLARVASLTDPFVYVSTKQENDRFSMVNNDKKAFDRALLNLTKDTERAKKFMRNYFKRIQLANLYFTSYKEGWKSDRGMIFIIFGLPDEVVKAEDREIWTYHNESRTSFTFVKASSVFDPDNYVLLRDKKYQQLWYETVDLWRNARF